MEKKNFEEIRELVTKKYEALCEVPHEYLNEKGRFMFDVYDELDNCFFEASNLEEYIDNVRLIINEFLLKPEWYWSPEYKEHKEKVAERMRKFVRHQIDKELWENIPEFAKRKENK